MSGGSAITTYNRNQTTAPGGGATLAILTLATSATYEIIVTAYFSGTAPVDGTDSDNLSLVLEGSGVAQPLVPAAANTLFTYKCLLTTGTTGVVGLVTVGAATAGTKYHTSIAATLVSETGTLML